MRSSRRLKTDSGTQLCFPFEVGAFRQREKDKHMVTSTSNLCKNMLKTKRLFGAVVPWHRHVSLDVNQKHLTSSAAFHRAP